jgi:hypothetical protein
MLLHESESKAWLTRDRAFGRAMHTGNQPEECGLAASVPAKDSPSVATTYSERYSREDPCCAELDTGIGD